MFILNFRLQRYNFFLIIQIYFDIILIQHEIFSDEGFIVF
jgi:hypothetical protein